MTDDGFTFSPLRLRVLTPAAVLLDVAQVTSIQILLADGGWMGIWPGHGALLAETLTGPLYYEDPAGEHSTAINAGILDISPDGVTVYTSGLASEEIAEIESAPEEEAARFDRITRALFAELGAHPEEAVDEEV